jgi:ABC-type dipeptide/oligopeptide/nickel transport system permease component
VYKYVLRRMILAVPVLLLSSLIVFALMRVMPGDALTALMAESGNVGEKEFVGRHAHRESQGGEHHFGLGPSDSCGRVRDHLLHFSMNGCPGP